MTRWSRECLDLCTVVSAAAKHLPKEMHPVGHCGGKWLEAVLEQGMAMDWTEDGH